MEKKPAAAQRRRRVLRNLSAYVQCPFYRSGGERSITCQGAAPHAQTCMSFLHSVDREIWSLFYCCDIRRHRACPYGKLVEGLYDAEGRYCLDRISQPLAEAFEKARAQRAGLAAAHGARTDSANSARSRDGVQPPQPSRPHAVGAALLPVAPPPPAVL